MAGIFKVNEVVSIAVEIEKRGEAFYLQMADKARNETVRETLRFLAGEEVKHQRTFGDMLSRLEPLTPPPGSEEWEYWEYVNHLIDSNFLLDDGARQRAFSSAASDQDAIRLAIGFEKESILFFSEMRRLVPGEQAKTVDGCIQEERAHLRKLAQALQYIA